ncbi:MAG: ECF transporter S component [Clostridia bacterium]|nr:ECF transporter S component [Clostridia bacterium]MBP3652333.1 ECF transporter S component [Clostridia bacterium]
MNHNQMRSFVLTALFIALILLLGLTPVGMIPLGFINISLLGVPVVIGTLFLGLKTGLTLGFCFGAVSALSAFGIYGTPSALAGALVAANPFLAALMCFVPRLLIPVFTHLVFKLLSRRERGDEGKATRGRAAAGALAYVAVMVALFVWQGVYMMWYMDALVLASAAGMYVLLCKRREAVAVSAAVGSLTNTVFYLGLMLLFYVIMGIDSEKVLVLIGGTGLIAGTAEALINAWISTPVMMALWKLNKQK